MQGLVKVSQFFGKTFVLWVLVAAGTCFTFCQVNFYGLVHIYRFYLESSCLEWG